MANWFEPVFQRRENFILRQIRKLFPKTFQVAEGVFVNEADEAEQFEQRILQRGGREQQFIFASERKFQRVGNDVGRLVNIPEPVRFNL